MSHTATKPKKKIAKQKSKSFPCRSYEELKALREIALVQLRRRLGEGGGGGKRTPASSPQGGAAAWLWGGWYSAPPSSPTAAQPPLTGGPPSPAAQPPPLTKGEEVFLQALQQESEVMGVAHKDVVFRQEEGVSKFDSIINKVCRF
jgi:hypothetical protein